MRQHPDFCQSVLKRVATGAVLGLGLSLASLAQATDSSAAAVAVAKLLALPLPGSVAPAPAADAAKRPMVTTLKGENLDRVIRRVLPQLPFKDDFVRMAFTLLNPDTLGNHPTRVLPAGTALQVPTPQDLAALLSAQYPALGKATTAVHDDAPAAPAANKRRWVQYP